MKPIGKIFDRSWRLTSRIERVNQREVDTMIKTHYLGKWPREVVLTLGLIRKSRTLGVVTFSVAHPSVAAPYLGEVWELSRLWIDDSVPKNAETFAIGRSIRYVRANHSNVKTLVSFADPEAGHNGTIYTASNWTLVQHESKHLFIYELQ